ncbi:MAG: hypothetical protein IH958_00365 [Chloroflexi bacterium]|nr:hypothetical protein [Chloroflexota bacterium]
MRTTLLWAFATASLAAFLWLAATAPDAVEASQGADVVSTQAGLHGDDADGFQSGEEDITADDDDRVPVQVWTVLAAGGAMAAGLVLFMVRLAVGWVKPASLEEESHH